MSVRGMKSGCSYNNVTSDGKVLVLSLPRTAIFEDLLNFYATMYDCERAYGRVLAKSFEPKAEIFARKYGLHTVVMGS